MQDRPSAAELLDALGDFMRDRAANARDRWERGLVRIDTATGAMTPIVRDGRLYGGVQMSRDGRRFVFSLSNGDRPADLHAADAAFTCTTVPPAKSHAPMSARKPAPQTQCASGA